MQYHLQYYRNGLEENGSVLDAKVKFGSKLDI